MKTKKFSLVSLMQTWHTNNISKVKFLNWQRSEWKGLKDLLDNFDKIMGIKVRQQWSFDLVTRLCCHHYLLHFNCKSFFNFNLSTSRTMFSFKYPLSVQQHTLKPEQKSFYILKCVKIDKIYLTNLRIELT